MSYDLRQISNELMSTALGKSYYGNALRVAKDLPNITNEERSLLDRWATGQQSAGDSWDLQRLAIGIAMDNVIANCERLAAENDDLRAENEILKQINRGLGERLMRGREEHLLPRPGKAPVTNLEIAP